MQQRGCEKVQLLLSKYADNEATPAEREEVDSHILGCEACAAKLAGYMEVAAIFSTEPRKIPEPQLRAGVFQQIHRLKEEERQAKRRAEESRPWYLPARPSSSRRSGSALARAWETLSPFAAAAMTVFAIVAAVTFFSSKAPVKPQPDDTSSPFQPVPTAAAPIASMDLSNDDQASGPTAPGPMPTAKPMDATFSPTSLVVTTFPTAILGQDEVIRVSRPQPVMEEGDAANMSTWHAVSDPTHGYTIAYPPNWWTQVTGDERYFFPWGPGGIAFAPYWLELRVMDNAQGYTPASYNKTQLGGRGTVNAPGQLRYRHTDEHNGYDEVYAFSTHGIYVLRLSVPHESTAGAYSKRWAEGEDIFSRMSGRLVLPSAGPTGLGYAPVLFLNGSDLWMMDPAKEVARAITHGYNVRQFALSPDMKVAAFTSAKKSDDLWGRSVYVARLDNPSADPVTAWYDMADIHDIAWYGDRELMAIAQPSTGDLGVYRVGVPQPAEGSHPNQRVTRIATLPDNKISARALSVSPDRQLLAFLAPISESAGTDLYALRPDGTDIMTIVSHNDPLVLGPGGSRALTPDHQALKSYVWTSGHLEYDGYRFQMLFTCGKSDSPTLYRGGFLFSSAGTTSGPLLNQELLRVSDPYKMQIVDLAYSASGKVALTGYYNDQEGRADVLAGLWTADVVDGSLANVRALPIPDKPHGITDLQWSPDGGSLVYRETIPQNASTWSDRYDGQSPFRLVKLELRTERKFVLYPAGQ